MKNSIALSIFSTPAAPATGIDSIIHHSNHDMVPLEKVNALADRTEALFHELVERGGYYHSSSTETLTGPSFTQDVPAGLAILRHTIEYDFHRDYDDAFTQRKFTRYLTIKRTDAKFDDEWSRFTIVDIRDEANAEFK